MSTNWEFVDIIILKSIMTTMFLCFIATVNGNTNPQFLIWFSHLGVSEGQYVMDSG